MVSHRYATHETGLGALVSQCGAGTVTWGRMRRSSLWMFVGFVLLQILVMVPRSGSAAEDEQQIESELAEVRADLVKAFNARDIDLLLSYCHPEVIASWPHGKVAVGHDEVRKVIDELLGGDQRVIESYKTDPMVESRVILNEGKTVVSRGIMNDEYTLVRPSGKEIALHSNWTATLVKIDQRWLIASFHLSANAFDNEAIDLFSTMARNLWGGAGGVAGLLIGGLLGFLFGRRSRRGAP